MSNRMNGQWRLKSRPVGMVTENDFEYVSEAVPDLGENELLIRNLYFAFEPAMRGWLNDVKSYVPAVSKNKHPFSTFRKVSSSLGVAVIPSFPVSFTR
jgi:NADPH-dependent curcumin reductase CurA